MNSRSSSSPSPAAITAGILGGIALVILVIWALVLVGNWISARATPQAGEIGVVRNGPSSVWIGDWFNGHGIRNVVTPGSGSTYIGLGSDVHRYPADSVQRNYTITSDASRGDRPGIDVVEVPTSDSVRVGLEGTFYFTTAFNAGPNGKKLIEDFDNRFGVRTFPVVGQTGQELHPWQGIDGWESFLDTVVRPIIDNDLRRSIANVNCAQLVSSCALVHQQSVTVQSGQNSAEIQQIQDQINASLKQDITNTLGQDYFSNIQFLLAKVTLPGQIQDQIDQAQAAYAAVGSAAAKVKQAHQEFLANQQKELGYKACSACAEAAVLAAIPGNVTTFAPGAGFSITTH